MRLSKPFDPIEVGEVDIFAFDFTLDVGGADIVSSQWTCRPAPFSAVADPVANTRIVVNGNGAQRAVQSRAADGSLQTKNGYFGVAQLGPLPASVAGATYILDCVAFLTDGRQIALNSTVQCVLPGQ